MILLGTIILNHFLVIEFLSMDPGDAEFKLLRDVLSPPNRMNRLHIHQIGGRYE